MDPRLRQSMLRYYDERASEYEEAYVRGTGTASIPDPDVFRREAALLAGVVERFARGRIIDRRVRHRPLAAALCRTLFEHHASSISRAGCWTSAGRRPMHRVSPTDARSSRPTSSSRRSPERAYDCALVGFLLSHLTEEQERLVFEKLGRVLDVSGRFLILDSAWSPERARFNAKTERQERRLNDGTRFEVYKRYIDRAGHRRLGDEVRSHDRHRALRDGVRRRFW